MDKISHTDNGRHIVTASAFCIVFTITILSSAPDKSHCHLSSPTFFLLTSRSLATLLSLEALAHVLIFQPVSKLEHRIPRIEWHIFHGLGDSSSA